MKNDHNPKGDPCSSCGKPALYHRVEHKMTGDPCSCGLPASCHRVRTMTPARVEKQRRKDRRRTENGRGKKRWDAIERGYVGFDGEGVGNFPHLYNMLAASSSTDEDGRCIKAATGKQLTSVECLEFILSLSKKKTKIFGYSLGYDITKMLEDLPDEKIYKLLRPELRARKKRQEMGPQPVSWKNYKLNYMGSQFSVSRVDITGKREESAQVWDIFKFFAMKFTLALQDWKVGSQDELDFITMMKERRDMFDKLSPAEIERYCLRECSLLAQLAKKLTEAHETAGIPLKRYDGAGSSASAMLSAMGIKGLNVTPDDPRLNEAAAMAFFGGRFENSVLGAVVPTKNTKIHSWDISSAYPYHTTFLPCLVHGKWRLTKDVNDLAKSNHGLVRYKLKPLRGSKWAWGPFPFRVPKKGIVVEGKKIGGGTIIYPLSGTTGWVHLSEFKAACKTFPNIEFLEAYVYEKYCDCKPFSQIPHYYAERCRIGKEGPGLSIKLGVNSVYGKLAQSVGSRIFNSWLWAGEITAGCRAQILDILSMHKDHRNLLMIATDGFATREDFTGRMPLPRDTGTAMCESKGKKVPLGGWEYKLCEKGLMLIRPGIYFPLEPSEKDYMDKKIKARGLGARLALDYSSEISLAFTEGYGGCVIGGSEDDRKILEKGNVARAEGEKIKLLPFKIGKDGRRQKISRFIGAKTGITRHVVDDKWVYKRSGNYGCWVERPQLMSFDPMPKRIGRLEDGMSLKPYRLRGVSSAVYSKTLGDSSNDARMLKRATQELLEQPDADYVDFGGDDYESV